MKQKLMKRTKAITQRLLLVALILCQLCICIPDHTAKAATEGTTTVGGGIFSTSKFPTILYIGNSKTYYNGMPRMVENLMYKDTSCTSPSDQSTSNFYALTWGAHSLLSWATGWDKDKNSDTKGHVDANLYDVIKGTKLSGEKDRVNIIRSALYDEADDPRKFDAVVLQGNPSDLSGHYYVEAASAICQLLVDNGNITSDTTIVINSMYNAFTEADKKDSKKNNNIKISKLWDKQAKYDNNSLQVKSVLNSPEPKSLKVRNSNTTITKSSAFTDVRIAYCGRAFLNFLTAFNSKPSSNFNTDKTRQYVYSGAFSDSIDKTVFEPKMTKKNTKKNKKHSAINDLIISDGRHPTILGSLLEASVIYQTLNPSAYSMQENKTEYEIYCDSKYYGKVGINYFIKPLDKLNLKKTDYYGVGSYDVKATTNTYILSNIYSVAQKTCLANRDTVYNENSNPFTNALANYKAENYFPAHRYNCEVDGVTVNSVDCYATYSGLTSPTKDGYTFTGWNSSPNGDGFNIDNEVALGADDVTTIYAIWDDNTETQTNGIYDVKIIKTKKKNSSNKAVIRITKPKKTSSVSGFFVKISAKKNMRNASTYFIKYTGTKKDTITLNVTLASKNKTNYVKLVAYKKNKSKYTYGKWTDVAEVK